MKTISDIINIRNNKYYIERLVDAQTIVPFVGAGMSAEIYPTWRKFFEEFDLLSDEKKQLNRLLDEGSFEDAASFVNSISERLFVDSIKNIFSPTKLDSKLLNSALRILPSIVDDIVLTTNIDEVLELAWHVSGKDFDLIITPDCEDLFNQAIIEGAHTLIKLHGTVKESSKYVLTREQYNRYYGNNSEDDIDFNKPFPRDLGRAIQSKTLLFLGCSLKNDRFLHALKKIAGWNEYIRHYAILKLADSKEENICRERELAQYGIYPIWIPDYDYITIILNELIQLKKKI